ncbi:MAG: carboxypeptidase regulatory-like domain-containing protein, partial [Pyrinomonadaceae bacterium]|nr:carboxypeptidase regulatory-like domain-containing protein [Pyrinomonadaceae bacterium]
STFTERGESPLAVAAFDPTSPDGRADISQPAPGESLDAQSDRLMYRAAYRNFGTHESLVVNQTVRVSPIGQTYRGGVRVYELRKTNGAFGIREQATLGTADKSRWLGSAAQDYQGNLAFGYSVSSETEKPAITYSGKLATDPTGVFRDEVALIKGTGVQTGFGSRWGDYSQMSVDPTDDCTFWLTNEYYSAESQQADAFGWLTRIGKFKFNECTSAPRATISGVVLNAANNQPIIYETTVTANAVYTRNVNPATGSYGNLTLVPGTYALTAAARGFRSQTVTVTLADGQTLTQNFALQPAALIERVSVNITAESCAVNNAVEPSETVTVNAALNNSGAANTNNLIVTLLPTGGVTSPGQPQNYGIVGGSQVLRPFTFTASPDLRCGDPLTLTFQLQDGAENLGIVTTEIRAGVPRTTLVETFGATGAPNLPPGWTTSAIGAQEIWKTSMTFHQTPPLAAYSFASAQVGINELVSPVFQINSPEAKVTFRNRYDLETTFLRNKLYDGAVLEIKIGGGFFQDIIQAGGAFEAGGYDGAIDNCCQNPLAGRQAWSGKSGPNQTPQFVTSTVRLPARAAGKSVRLRWRVGTDNGTFREGQYIDDVHVSDGYECACQVAPTSRAPFDFDGDGATDLSIYRPSDDQNQPDFYVRNSSNNSSTSAAWGSVGDAAVNADYDGDGRTDYAIFRPVSGTWFILRSSDNSTFPISFGLANDKLVPADYDGDGRGDIAVYRPSNRTWYISRSLDGQLRSIQFGAAGDLPVPADYDGDNRIDVAVFRPSNGTWYVLRSSDNGVSAVPFGQSGDQPVAGDYDGDNQADYVVFRPSNGIWYQLKTAQGFSAVSFGASGDRLLQADFDGDGKRDLAVYRQSPGVWYYLRSSDGAFAAKQFGGGGDIPLPTIFVPQP